MGMLNLLTPYLRNSFRKRLGKYSYKIGNKHAHKKQGVIPLHVKNNIIKVSKGSHHGKLTIRNMELRSQYPFGEFTHKGFKADMMKVPLIDIPDLSETQLKPYVTYMLPKIKPNKSNK